MKKIKNWLYNILFRIFARLEMKKQSTKELNKLYSELVRQLNRHEYGDYTKEQFLIVRNSCRKELRKRERKNAR